MKRFFVIYIVVTACSIPNKEKEVNTPPSKLINQDNPAGPNTCLPHLVRGPKNSLYFSWVKKSGDTTFFQYATFQNDNWTTPNLIASGTDWFVNWADYPMVSAVKDGKMAHFLAKSSAGTYSYDVNLITEQKGKWSEAFIPHTDGTPTEHGFVTMLPLTDSTFQVAWLDGRNTGGDHGHGDGAMTLRTAVIGLDGSINEETELDNRTCDCCQTGGAITSNGPVFVYRDRSELEIRDIYITRKVDGQWTEPRPIAQDNWKIAGCPVNGPRADAINETLGVAWYTAANGQPKIQVIFSTNAGQTFGEPITIDAQSPLGRVDLSMIDEESAMVSWLTKEGDLSLIKARRVFKNGSMEAPIVISQTSDSRGSGFPQMAKVGNELFFAWTVLEGENTSIDMAKLTL